MSLRLAFVEAVESPAPVQPGPTGAVRDDPAGGLEGKPASDAAAEADGRKKFSKKY